MAHIKNKQTNKQRLKKKKKKVMEIQCLVTAAQ